MQILTHLARVRSTALVADYQAPRHDSELGQLRQVIKEIPGDPVADVFSVGIAGYVDERHYGQRIGGLGA
jgi:hypothetical protein